MKKSDLVNMVAEVTNGTKVQASQIVEGIIEAIITSVSKGNDVDLAGFGKFMSVKRAARTARNPRTGEEVNVPAQNVPKFRPAKAFKDRVKKG